MLCPVQIVLFGPAVAVMLPEGTVTEAVPLHPPASVTDTEYVPAFSPVAVALDPPEDQL